MPDRVEVLPPAIIESPDPEVAIRLQASFEALAPNTRRAYVKAMTAWRVWALVHGVDVLTPSPLALRLYMQERSASGTGISSLRLTVSTLRKVQGLAGMPPTASDQIVTDTLSVLAKETAPPRQAAALTAEALAAIAATATLRRADRRGRRESKQLARRRGLVDIALCRVLSDAGLRRSEAAALTWDDVAVWEDGSGRLTVRRSKTDAGARTVYITPAAVDALNSINNYVNGHNCIQNTHGVPPRESPVFGLTPATIGRRIKRAAAAAGLGAGFSGHSGRVGMARRMAKAGAPTHEIMAQGRWKTARMVEVYTRAEEAGRAAEWLE